MWTIRLVASIVGSLCVACSSGSGGGDGGGGGGGDGMGGGACTQSLKRGCVDLLNFSGQPVNIFKTGDQPGPSNLVPSGNPGFRGIAVDSTDGATTSFTVVRGGTTVGTLDCTVGPNAWVSINPSVVVQPNGDFQCQGWAF